MNSNLYRLVYCSRNHIDKSGPDLALEIQNILEKSRRNNARQDVTGALFYNEGNFAQVLEGPMAAVAQTFERVQCDPRHSEVTVIESGIISRRDFPDWAMAFTGTEHNKAQSDARAAFGDAFSETAGAGAKIMDMLRKLIVQEDEWILVDA